MAARQTAKLIRDRADLGDDLIAKVVYTGGGNPQKMRKVRTSGAGTPAPQPARRRRYGSDGRLRGKWLGVEVVSVAGLLVHDWSFGPFVRLEN